MIDITQYVIHVYRQIVHIVNLILIMYSILIIYCMLCVVWICFFFNYAWVHMDAYQAIFPITEHNGMEPYRRIGYCMQESGIYDMNK